MSDPRTDNCKAFATNAAGMVTGVYLEVASILSSRYELVRAELVDEANAGGNTVATCAVLDANGIQTAETVYLAWPYPSMSDGKAPPGNPNNQHMMSGLTYNPPDMGPGALYVGDNSGAPISDIIGGLGLPFNRHVCYRLTWRERSPVAPDPEPDPETDPAIADVVALLREIRDLVKAGFRL